MNYEKLTSAEEATEFLQQIIDLPYAQSGKKIYLMCKDSISKHFLLNNSLWLEWCKKNKGPALNIGTEFKKLIDTGASDEELQECVNSYLNQK